MSTLSRSMFATKEEYLKATLLEGPGKADRYASWCQQVDKWAAKHGITRKQAVSILFWDCAVDPDNSFDKLFWAEANDFAQIIMNH